MDLSDFNIGQRIKCVGKDYWTGYVKAGGWHKLHVIRDDGVVGASGVDWTCSDFIELDPMPLESFQEGVAVEYRDKFDHFIGILREKGSFWDIFITERIVGAGGYLNESNGGPAWHLGKKEKMDEFARSYLRVYGASRSFGTVAKPPDSHMAGLSPETCDMRENWKYLMGVVDD